MSVESASPPTTGFPHAPEGWTPEQATITAGSIGLRLRDSHWDLVRALQEYFDRHRDKPGCNSRDLHDALEERFHSRGGMRFLYELFPGGPVTQGCRIGGLQLPPGCVDPGFGSSR